jgi:large subunit ribosomal protein L25
MQSIMVEGTIRESRGKGPAKQSRRAGLVPAVMYGGRKEPVSVNLNARQLTRILKSDSGRNSILTMQVGGGEEKAMLKDWQVDPVSGALLHVDLLRVAMDVRMRVKVVVHTFGEPTGVKMQGGIFETVTREVEIECLPADIPDEFRVDVSGLMIHMQLRAADLALDPEKMKLITDPQRVLAHVVTLKKEEEVAPEAAAAATTEAAAEPEVIKKGKKEEEGEEGAEPEKAEKKPEKKGGKDK